MDPNTNQGPMPGGAGPHSGGANPVGGAQAPLKVNIPDSVKAGVYSNAVSVSVDSNQVAVDFGYLLPNTNDPEIEVVARVNMNHKTAESFMKVLGGAMEDFKKKQAELDAKQAAGSAPHPGGPAPMGHAPAPYPTGPAPMRHAPAPHPGGPAPMGHGPAPHSGGPAPMGPAPHAGAPIPPPTHA